MRTAYASPRTVPPRRRLTGLEAEGHAIRLARHRAGFRRRFHETRRGAPSGEPLKGSDEAAPRVSSFIDHPEEAKRILEERLGPGLEIAELTLRPDRADADVRDPKKPQNLDNYDLDAGGIGTQRGQTSNSKCREAAFTWRVHVGGNRESGYVKYDLKRTFLRAYH